MQHHSSLETYPLFRFFYFCFLFTSLRRRRRKTRFFSRSSSEKVEGNIYPNLFPLLADPLTLILFIFLQSHRLPTKVSSVTHWVITDNMWSRFHLYCRFVNNKYWRCTWWDRRFWEEIIHILIVLFNYICMDFRKIQQVFTNSSSNALVNRQRSTPRVVSWGNV